MTKDEFSPLALMACATSIAKRFARGDDGAVIPDNALQTAHRAATEAAAFWQQAASTHESVMAAEFKPLTERIEVSRKAVSNLGAIAARRLQSALDKLKSEVKAI